MWFWSVAILLTGAVCFLLVRALAARPEVAPRANPDVAFYKAQIAEIARQRELGLIGEGERKAAEAEAGRRLLAVGPEATASGGGSRRLEKIAAIAMLVAVPAIAFGAYARFGSPAMPAMPLASRPPPAEAPGSVPVDIADAVSKIEAHLARNPDGKGFEVVAPVYLRLGRFDDAVRAYSEALRLLGPTPDRHAGLAEALVYQANGVVTAAAKSGFLEALKLDPAHVRSRMFSAMAAEQDGDKPRAIALLTALARDLPEGELKGHVAARLAELGGQPPPAAGVPAGGEAIAALPAEQRAAAIRSMVENLSERLATQGGSAEEWARLVRALAVLGDTDRARAILAEARQKFAAKPDDLRLIETAAGALARPAP